MSVISALPGATPAISATTSGSSFDNNATTSGLNFDSVLGEQMNTPAHPDKQSAESEKSEDKSAIEAQTATTPDPISQPTDILNLILSAQPVSGLDSNLSINTIQAQSDLIAQANSFADANNQSLTAPKASDQPSTPGSGLDSSQAPISENPLPNENGQFAPIGDAVNSTLQAQLLNPVINDTSKQQDLGSTPARSAQVLNTSQTQSDLIAQANSFADANNQLSSRESNNSTVDDNDLKVDSQVFSKSVQTELAKIDSLQPAVESTETHSEPAFNLDNAALGISTTENRANTLNVEATKTSQSATQAQYPIAPHFHDSGWSQAVNNRIVWMANNQIQSAQLTVNPENLGPIQIHIEIDAQQIANVQFFVAHSDVQKALQDSMPNLNQMFAQSGISLGQSNVDSQASQSQQQFNKSSKFQGSTEISNDDIETMTINSSTLQGSGIINTIA